ncbi:MAG: glycerate kinase [Clostridia bacterium]|nr:glycerate kinase [Clostridia bacterium]
MKTDALKIIDAALKASSPRKNVADALSQREYADNITLIAAGKAACTMADAAYDVLGDKIRKGYVITKYFHSFPLPDVFEVFEAGHPLPDENSVKHTKTVIDAVKNLTEKDKVIFLLSGGASALFESPVIPLESLIGITEKLLRCGADITEINIIRKKLSSVKGGNFAKMCPCDIDCFILSDVLGDRIEMIASGPCCDDKTTAADAENIIKKYNLDFDLPGDIGNTEVTNAENHIIGSLGMLCDGAKKCAESLGYKTHIMTTSMTGEAREKAGEIAKHAIEYASSAHEKTVFIYGGETTVTIKGTGTGGRNQEIALSAAIELKNTEDILIFSLGSDGTDGPTDAAGGMADGHSYEKMISAGISPEEYLNDNNSYDALKTIGDIIITGPTGTNVNDITVVIIQ